MTLHGERNRLLSHAWCHEPHCFKTADIGEISTVVRNPELSSVCSSPLLALTDHTITALIVLIEREFLHAIDAPSLVLIVPTLHCSLRDRGATTKRYEKHLNLGQQFRVLRAIWYLHHLGVTGPREALRAFVRTLNPAKFNSVPPNGLSPYKNADLHSFLKGVGSDTNMVPTYRDDEH